MEARDVGRQGRQRRGGLGDAGGLGGGLPAAAPVAVGSEAALRAELDRLAALLAPSVEWTQRCEALLRLEGLVRGGAADWPAFPELLAGLRDVLAAQMQERRSAVSRQACHAVCELAAACGPAFEPLAVHLLPVVFKALAMGIQVVSEAADACAHAMVAHCPSARLLPKLCAVLSSDRNGRLRQCAAEFLLAVLERWDPAEVERQLEHVEHAVMAAVADAQAETRATGRALFGAFAHAWPAAAQAALARLGRDRAQQERLAAAAAEYVPGLPDGLSLSQPVSRRSSLGNSGATTPRGALSRSSSFPAAAPGGSQAAAPAGGAVRLLPIVPKLALPTLDGSTRGSPSHPSSARSAAASTSGSLVAAAAAPRPATARENHPDNRAAPVQCTPRSMFPKTRARREAAAAAVDAADAEAAEASRPPPAGRERLPLRRSMGGAALRMSVAAFRREAAPLLEDDASQPAAAAAAAPPPRGSLRVPLPLPAVEEVQDPQQAQQAAAAAGVRPLTARRLCAADRQPSSIAEDSEVSSMSSGWEEAGAAAPPAALAPLLAGLAKAGQAWGDRVALFQGVQDVLQQPGAAAQGEVASNADRLSAALLEGAGDAHFRVAAAALGALRAGLAGPCSRVFEPQLDRLMTALFARVADPKEQIRGLVGSCLAAARQQHSGDAVVAALARSLQANRAPKVKCAVMGFFAAAARGADVGCSAARSEACEAGEQQAPAQPLLLQLAGSSAALGGLVRSLLQLAVDKNPDIRRAAADAVAAAYNGGGAGAVQAAVQALPPADALAVQRAIGPAVQQGGSSSSGEMPPPPPRHSSKPASRRQSSEGLKHLASQQQQQQQRQQPPRPESSGSLTARSRQGSQTGSPPRAKLPPAAPIAAAAAPAVAPVHLTPEPPSPFAWRAESASPLPCKEEAGEQQPAAAAADAAAGVQAAAPAPQQEQQHAGLQPSAAPPAADLAPFDDVTAGQLQRLLSQLGSGPSCEAMQGLSRLAHVLPAAAWAPCFEQVAGAVCEALDSGSPVLRDAALMLARDLAAAAQPSLFLPALPALLPRMLAAAAEQEAREVAAAADEALEALLARAPPQSCLGLLLPALPAPGTAPSTDRAAGAALHAAVRSLRRVAARMQPAGLAAHLQPQLVPGLCAAYGSPLSDVRKATVDCLVAIWQVVGDAALRPHLEPLSASQRKLLDIFIDRARAAAAR